MGKLAHVEDRIRSEIWFYTQALVADPARPHDLSRVYDAIGQVGLEDLAYWEWVIWDAARAARMDLNSPWRRFASKNDAPVTWLDLCDKDGHRRERALRTLDGPAPNSFFFAILFRRLNDWVPQVRDAARQAFPAIFTSTSPELIAAVLWTILPKWTTWCRMEKSERQVVLEIISDHRIAECITELIVSIPAGRVASILGQVVRVEAYDQYLSEIATRAIQPAVRAKAYDFLLEQAASSIVGQAWKSKGDLLKRGRMALVTKSRPLTIDVSFYSVLESAVRDRSAQVRRRAADLMIRKLDTLTDEAIPIAVTLAADRHFSVAERGEWLLHRLRSTDSSASTR